MQRPGCPPPVIHVLGNSHVNIFRGTDTVHGEDTLPLFRTYSLGPTIAYNFYQHHYPRALSLVRRHVDKTKDYVCLVVGEVDCRWHLLKQQDDQRRPIEELVQECVARFFRCYLDLQAQGYKCIAWGSHPSTTAGPCDDLDQPVYGHCHTRNRVSILFHDALQEQCRKACIPFVSILHHLITDDGLTDMNFFLDYCHLKASLTLPLVTKQLIALKIMPASTASSLL